MVKLVFKTQHVRDGTFGVGSIFVSAQDAARIAQEIRVNGQSAIDRLPYDSVGHGPTFGARYPMGHIAVQD